jgi:DNA mismatch repair protein MutS2
MLYPEKNIEVKLGFDKIRQFIKEACYGDIGRELVDKMQFSTDYNLIKMLTIQTEEFTRILMEGVDFPSANFLDVRNQLDKAKIRNTFLTTSEFFDLKRSLDTLYHCLQFFDKQKDTYPNLYALCEEIILPFDLLQNISKVIDDEGRLKNNASRELQNIRQDIIRTQVQLRKQMDILVRDYKSKDLMKGDSEVTIREGRMVLPVKAEYKRQVKGIVHHASATGQTVYIEPTIVLNMNNKIKELEFQERREIIRILTELTNQVRPHISKLSAAYRFLAKIDFIRAKARFASKIDAINPAFEKTCLIDWKAAYHPLLLLAHKEQNKKIVPHSVFIDHHDRILLISGPNAGGKSVALKTVGLLQYMYQNGLLIPVAEGSKVGIFRDIFIDIGDEQSIENDLSTYSSHLSNMRHFLKFADKRSLCLIDEFGTGTEPQFGGAIAETILENLCKQKVFAVITTHYSNLKLMAENTKGIVNGAMRFDVENLEPLYHLEIGQAGSSFALEIAQKIGLPQEVIKQARSKIGASQIDIERLIKDLEQEKRIFREKNAKVISQEQELQSDIDNYKFLKKQIELTRKNIVNEAKVEAKSLLQVTNQKIENTIREIKEAKADKETTQKARQELNEFKEEITPQALEKPVEEFVNKKKAKRIKKGQVANPEASIKVIEGEIKVGDSVRIKGQTTIGEVLSINKKDISIAMGSLKTIIKKNRLEKISQRGIKKIQRSKAVNYDFAKEQINFSPEMDIRGKRADETYTLISNFMDQAIMLSHSNLRIVHGKGTGALRQIVRDILNTYKEVNSVKNEHPDRGGDGVSLIKLH